MLEGAYNFRDLGGLRSTRGQRVRTGRLYRSDTLQALTAKDVRILLQQVGLRGIVDLRLASEVSELGRGPLEQVREIRYVNVPMQMAATEGVPADEVMDHLYLGCLAPQVNLAGVIESICALADQPVVFHCAAGKDRTGVVAAIVLRLLGVADQDIIAGYMRSAEAMDRMVARFQTWPIYRDHMAKAPPQAYSVHPEPLLTLLRKIDRDYGSAKNWALRHGIAPDVLDKLSRECLEA